MPAFRVGHFRCARCKEAIPEAESRQHTIGECKAAAKTFLLIKHGFRPFPRGTSLPTWVIKGGLIHETRGAYEGEPREEQKLLAAREPQLWVPRWIDVIVELWSGPVYIEGDTRRAQRDQVLRAVSGDTAIQHRIVDAYREDLRAVREILRPYIEGPAPKLLSEHEAEKRRLHGR